MDLKEILKPTLIKLLLAVIIFLILPNYLYYSTACPLDAPQVPRNCPNGFVFTNFSGLVMLKLYFFGTWRLYSMFTGYSPSILWFSFVYHSISSYLLSCIILFMLNKIRKK